jgi:hypothetical protein
VSVRADRPGDQRDAHFRIRLIPALSYGDDRLLLGSSSNGDARLPLTGANDALPYGSHEASSPTRADCCSAVPARFGSLAVAVRPLLLDHFDTLGAARFEGRDALDACARRRGRRECGHWFSAVGVTFQRSGESRMSSPRRQVA